MHGYRRSLNLAGYALGALGALACAHRPAPPAELCDGQAVLRAQSNAAGLAVIYGYAGSKRVLVGYVRPGQTVEFKLVAPLEAPYAADYRTYGSGGSPNAKAMHVNITQHCRRD